jgi:hypothetical protein
VATRESTGVLLMANRNRVRDVVLASFAVVSWIRRPSPELAAAAGAGLIYPFMDWEVIYPLSNVPRIGGWLFPLLAVGLGGSAAVREPRPKRQIAAN